MYFRFSHQQKGFTLLEILAAFLIFGLAFAVAMRSMSGSLRNTRVSGEMTQAALYAQSKLEILGIEEAVEEGSSSGTFDDHYHWSLEVVPYAIAEESSINAELVGSLYQVNLEVYWERGRQESSANFTTLYAVDSNFNAEVFRDE